MSKEIHEIALPITGMNSASCTARVEEALKKVPGVSGTTVSLEAKRATVKFTFGEVDTLDLVNAVNRAGYDIPTEHLTLDLSGMTCASCAIHVEGALTDAAGVVAASVDLATGSAGITFIPGQVGLTEIKAAVAGCGYQVLEKAESAAL